jgi:hypothetical protein
MYLHPQKMLVTILQIRLLQPNTHLKQLMGLNAISFSPSGVQYMAFLMNFVMRWGDCYGGDYRGCGKEQGYEAFHSRHIGIQK